MENEIKQIGTGSCLCKGITYEIIGEPVTSVVCHCIDCKKASGSAFMANVLYKQDVSSQVYIFPPV